MNHKMITYEKFQESLKILSICQEEYHSSIAPASVDNILFPRHSGFQNDVKILLEYFYQEKGIYNKALYKPWLPSSEIYSQWKLQNYINFIRSERDKLFPNNYRKKSRKFISHLGYYRSSLLEQYQKDIYGK